MKIKIRPSFLLYLESIALLSSVWAALSVVIALGLHELSHYAVSRLTGESIEQMELTPFGGVMTYKAGKSPSKGLRGVLVAAAGPMGNYLGMVLAAHLGAVGLDEEFARQLIMAHAAMMMVNLLPALPLDGGRVLFCIGYYFLGVSALITGLTGLGAAAGIAFLLLGLYGAVRMDVLNLSLLIVGVYLMVCAVRCRGVMLAENLYAVVQERLTPVSRTVQMKICRVPEDTPLYALIEPLARTEAAAFIYEDARGEHWVGEREICRALLKNPSIQISECAHEAAKGRIYPAENEEKV